MGFFLWHGCKHDIIQSLVTKLSWAQSFMAAFLLLHLNLFKEGDAFENKLIIKSDCICLGFNLSYECMVMGNNEGFTVWQGTALHNCSSGEISLLHGRFTQAEGAFGVCNEGHIVGRSLGVENGSVYISQLTVKVNSDVVDESIKCIRDDMDITSIGSSSISLTTVPFPPPNEVCISLYPDSRQFRFSWSPVAPDCPAVHYNILASNCGSCPTTTNHTTVTCTDVPVEQKTLCTFALQTVVCGDVAGVSSNTISVSLSDSISLYEDIDNGRGQLANSSSNGPLAALVSVIILLAISVAAFTTMIIALVRTKKRLQTQLARYKTTVKYNAAPETELKSASANVDTKKNIAYEPNPAAVNNKKNIAYKTNTVVVVTS